MRLPLHSPRSRDARLNMTYCLLVLFVAGTLSACDSLFEPSAESKKAMSADNLRQIGAAIAMYANYSRGSFPDLSPEWGHLVMDPDQIYPEYLSDPSVYVSPAHPDAKKLESLDDPKAIMRDHSYWYLGYAFRNEEAGLAFVELYRKHAREGSPLPDRMYVGTDITPTVLLGEGVARFYYAKPHGLRASIPMSWQVPVMIERPGLHEGGSNVLFTGGHVKFMEYPGEFPMTERFIHALESLDDLK